MRSAIASLALAILVTAACSDAASEREWAERWNDTLGHVPTLDAVVALDGEPLAALCEETLGQLRTDAVGLVGGPTADLEHAAAQYVDFAEAIFFECPIGSGEHAGFDASYAELDRLRTIVVTLLAFEG